MPSRQRSVWPSLAADGRPLGEAMRHGPVGLSPTYLSKCQGMSKKTISSLLRSLEQGLIERTLDPTDVRAFRIRWSSAGREIARASAPQQYRELNDLLDKLSRSLRAWRGGLDKTHTATYAEAARRETTGTRRKDDTDTRFD